MKNITNFLTILFCVTTFSLNVYTQNNPSITDFTPIGGTPGTSVTINGSALTTTVAVQFNGIAATFSIIDDNQLIATVPNEATTGVISVTNDIGVANSTNTFTVTTGAGYSPTIQNFSPTYGSVSTVVTIAGAHLLNVTSVTFNGTSASFTVLSDSLISATVPINAMTGPLHLYSSAGNYSTTMNFIVIQSPVITGFFPMQGLIGSTVSILGENLINVSDVAFNGISAYYSIISDTQIEATVPQGASTGLISLTAMGNSVYSSENFSVVLLGSVSGVVWNDADNDGIFNTASESTLSNWKVFLKNSSFAESTYTDANGAYMFSDVPAGEYVVRGQFHPLWMQTFPLQPNFHSVQINSGENFTDLNFGYRASGAVVLSTLPPQNGIHVPLQSNITASFSQSIDIVTLNNATINISGSQSGIHPANITYDNFSHTVILDPITDFQVGENVFVIFTKNILTTNGIAMEKSFILNYTVDVTGGTGIFAQDNLVAVGNNPRGIASADFDSDGDADFAVVNYGANTMTIVKNNTNGFSTNQIIGTGTNPSSLTTGDIDNDGDIDIVTTNYNAYNVKIFKNNGNATFTNGGVVSVGSGPIAGILRDVNGDGLADLLVANYHLNNVSLLLNNGNGNFVMTTSLPAETNPQALDGKDFDNDGDIDIAVLNFTSATVSLLFNDGLGNYSMNISYSVGSMPYAMLCSDFDSDGDNDIATTSYNTGTMQILSNDGTGNYSATQTTWAGNNPVSLSSGDYDADGDIDIVAADAEQSRVVILSNNGNANFTQTSTASTGTSPFAITSADFDNDGELDIAVANKTSNNISILTNNHRQASISGFVWNDENGNGMKDAEEYGIPNWQLFLAPAELTTFTDNNGFYFFTNLSSGAYNLNQFSKHGWMQTYPAMSSYSINLGAGQDITGIDFGNTMLPPVDSSLFTFQGLVNGHYYFISNEARNWTDAKNICYANGGHLVTINDVNENTLVQNFASTETQWLGLSDKLSDGIFYWITAEPFTYSNWALNEPSNASGEDFGVMLPTFNGTSEWADENGTAQHRFVLEIDGIEPPLSSIGGMVWNDMNENGLRETNEPSLSNWKINMNGAKNDSIWTNTNGMYTYFGLHPGEYMLSETQHLGWSQTFPTGTGNYVVNLGIDEHLSDKNFGNHLIPLTITSSASEYGQIVPSGVINVNYGSTRQFFITAHTGYYIENVVVDGINMGAITNYEFTNITENHTISATFSPYTYTINATAGEHGTISPVGNATVTFGSQHSVTITPDAGYRVDSVFVDGAFIGNVYTYTFSNIASNHSIYATFSVSAVSVTATAGANGIISPSGIIGANIGGNISFTFTPNEGYHIASIIVDENPIALVSNYEFINLTSNHSIAVTFAINQYSLTTSTDGNGIITPNNVTADYGATVNFAITPNEGYHITGVFADEQFVGLNNAYTFELVADNHNLFATFERNSYSIIAESGENGTIFPSGEINVVFGNSQQFIFTPHTGYHLENVLVDGNLIANASDYTFENISDNHTIAAAFAVNMYELIVNVVGNGTITQTPVMTMYPHGSFVEFSVMPAPHWRFSGWIGSLSGNNTNAGVIMNEPKIVTVTFEQLFPAYAASVSNVNFDTVLYGGTKLTNVTITNTGTDTLFLSSLTTDNSIFTVFADNYFVLPEQELAVQIEFSGNLQGLNEGNLLVTHNAINSPSIIPLMGYVLDIMKFRTITANVLLAGRPVNLKKNKLGIVPLPNVANLRDTIMKRSNGIVVGTQQGSFDSMKIYGWLEWKKGADIGKFFTSNHTGRSYPFDSIRLDGKKTKRLTRSFKADRKKYNNPLAEQFTAFKLNLIGSDYGTLPAGLRDVQLDLFGNIFNGMTLGEIEDSLDYALTYWNREPLLLDSARAEEIKDLLFSINNAFAVDMHDSTDVISNSPLVLRGKKQIAEVTFLKRTSPRSSNSIVRDGYNNIPEQTQLLQNYPNPFNPVTTIRFAIHEPQTTTLKVYDVLGREVAVLLNDAIMDAGTHEVQLDASNLSSGVYFYRLTLNDGEYQMTKKLLLMK